MYTKNLLFPPPISLNRLFNKFGSFLLSLIVAFLALDLSAAPISIPLVNSTGLASDSYDIYVLGYSTKSKLELTIPSGTTGKFTATPAGAGDIHSHKLGSEITKINFDFPADAIMGARIYFFIADKAIFQNAPQFSYSGDGAAVSQPNNPPNTAYPPFGFIELTSNPTYGVVIDVQTVDGFVFPINVTLNDGLGQIGQPLGNNKFHRKSLLDTYMPFMKALGADADPYYSLKYKIAYPKYPNKYADGLINPGSYLISKTTSGSFEHLDSPLNTVFDSALNTLFKNGDLSLRGPSSGSIAADYYTVTPVKEQPYPGSDLKHPAIKLKAKSQAALQEFTIFNPVGLCVLNYKNATSGKYVAIHGTIKNTILTFDSPLPSSTPLEVGMYVSGPGTYPSDTIVGGVTIPATKIASITKITDGITNVGLNYDLSIPSPHSQYGFSKAQNLFFTSGEMVFANNGVFASTPGESNVDRQTVLKALENQIVTALNRGVANAAPTSGDDGFTTKYWGTETNWYPAGQTQNLFSLYMHTAIVPDAGDLPIFTLPSNAVACARGTIMNQAYGFAYDENPGPVPPTPNDQPPVPSKYDPSPFGTNTLTITLGLWSQQTQTGTLTMEASGGGTTTPAVGVHNKPFYFYHPIKAVPDAGQAFKEWSVTGNALLSSVLGADSTVYLTGDATVTANFVAQVPENLTMAVAPNGAGVPSPATGPQYKQAPFKISANPNDGFTFLKWTISGTGSILNAKASTTYATLSSDATITATYATTADVSYGDLTIAVSTPEGGVTSPSPSTQRIPLGTPFNLQAYPENGYIFSKWEISSGAAVIAEPSRVSTTMTISGDATVTAVFMKNGDLSALTIAAIPVNGGTVNPGAAVYTKYHVGETVDIKMVRPASGYTFTGWTGVGVSIAHPKRTETTFVINEATSSVNANFTTPVNQSTLTINVDPPLKGNTTNPGAEVYTDYNVGGHVTVTALPAADYHFTTWAGTGLTIDDDTNPKGTATITGVISTLTAGFAENQLTVAIAHDSISEQEGTSPATVTRNSGTSGDLVVALTSDDINQATVPATVTIKDGSDSASFTVTGVDDGVQNAPKVVTITAKATNYIDGTDTVIVSSVTPFILTVKQGSGSGQHLAGAIVDISADSPETGQSFDKWTGDIANVADVNAVDTTITMPAAATTLTATYKVDPSSAIHITLGSKIELKASDISGMDSEFVKNPKVYEKDTDPVTGRSGRAITKAITRISSAAPNNIFESLWSRRIVLYNIKDRMSDNKKGISTANWIQNLPNKKIDDLECYLWAKGTTVARNPFNVNFKGALIVPPVITDILRWDGGVLNKVYTSGVVIVKGNYFGSKAPTVSLEYINPANGSIRRRRLKVLKPYKYANAKGKAGSSCMDLSSATGVSEIRVAMPKAWWSVWTPDNYDLVLDNRIGLATFSISTTDVQADPGTAPIANDDTQALQTGDSSYYIDVMVNDQDADSNAVSIIPQDALTNLKGRVSASRGKIRYTPPRGVLPGAFPDTFTYSLNDGHGGVSGNGKVTVDMNAITLDPVKNWNGEVLRTIQPGSHVIITGKNFGIKVPRVSMAVENARRIKLKVVSKAQYSNYKGQANRSFTDLSSGDGEITVELPKKAWVGYTNSTAYTITVSNRFDTVGADATVTTSGGNTDPIANDDNVDLLSGEKSYNIDVLANQSSDSFISFTTDGIDYDAESDKMTIILPSRTSKLGARLSVDRKTNTIKYTLPKGHLAVYIDIFKYSLQDPSGAVSGNATVTVKKKLAP